MVAHHLGATGGGNEQLRLRAKAAAELAGQGLVTPGLILARIQRGKGFGIAAHNGRNIHKKDTSGKVYNIIFIVPPFGISCKGNIPHFHVNWKEKRNLTHEHGKKCKIGD